MRLAKATVRCASDEPPYLLEERVIHDHNRELELAPRAGGREQRAEVALAEQLQPQLKTSGPASKGPQIMAAILIARDGQGAR